MSAAFHAQLASIMEVLANTAVAEICELVDSGYSVLQLEISRSRKENEVLRRKLRLMELRAVRATALRAAANANSTANSTARAQPPAHHPGGEARRNRTPAANREAVLCRVSHQEPLSCGDEDPTSDSGRDVAQRSPAAGESVKVTAVIKVEDDDEPWTQSEPDKDLCCVVDGQTVDAEAPPPLPAKQEAADEGGVSSQAWVSEEVSSTSMSISSQRTDSGSFEGLMFEPQLQQGSLTTQNPLREDPGCSYTLNTSERASSASDSGGSSFSFPVGELSLPSGFQSGQQRAPPPSARKEARERQSALIRRERWRAQGGASSKDDGTGKTFVCNFCGKTLACLKNLKTHMRVHTGEKPFVCALCGKRFSDSSNLKRHQSVHTGEKRYGCVHCGKRFAQSGSLKVHMSVHTDCKEFRCSYCGKTFISSSHLRRHVTVHAGEKRFTPTL